MGLGVTGHVLYWRHITEARMSNKPVPAFAIVLVLFATGAGACSPPDRPWFPSDPADLREYADLLQSDYEAYFRGVQAYLHCLDQERQRAFQEAQAVTVEYGQFLDLTIDARRPRSEN